MKKSIIVLVTVGVIVLGGCGDKSVTPKQISPESEETIIEENVIKEVEVKEIEVEPIKVQTWDNVDSTTGWVSDEYKQELEYNSKHNRW